MSLDAPSNTLDIRAAYRLLQASAILGDSRDPEYRLAAYRIAVDSFLLYRDELPNLHNLLHVIFGKLGNFPAVDFLYRLLGRDKEYSIPSGALHELIQHEHTNMVSVGDKEILFTDFQRSLWSSLDSELAVSVSAPTSAGKSFALQQYIIHALHDKKIQFVLYLVPTRALIHQVSETISSTIFKMANDIIVSTIPQTPSELGMKQGVFILTQERAHILVEADSSIRFQLIVLDEAQTIGEGVRGILLQVVMEKLLRDNRKAKFFFGSPFVSNPSHFRYMLDTPLHFVKEVTSPVSQNLIMADIDTIKTNLLTLSLCANDGSAIKLTDMQLAHDVHGDEPTFAYVSYLFGKSSKSLVYAGSPAKCEDIADKIRQWKEMEIDESKPTKELNEFATFVREHIHKDYILADMIERGISFHYGKMPTILRKAIEYYFANNSEMRFWYAQAHYCMV